MAPRAPTSRLGGANSSTRDNDDFEFVLLRRFYPAIRPVVFHKIIPELQTLFNNYKAMGLVNDNDNLAIDKNKDMSSSTWDLKMAFQAVYLKAYPAIQKAITHLAAGLGGPVIIDDYAAECVNIAAGISQKYTERYTGKNRNIQGTIIPIQQLLIEKKSPDTFPKFGRLPTELRLMILKFAVRAEDRIVTTNHLRRVKKAPCPVLFLVCRETYNWSQEFYQRIPRGDLWRPAVPTNTPVRGPIVSFETDIIDIGDWYRWWKFGGGRKDSQVRKCRREGSPLPRTFASIESFSQRNKIRRVVRGPTSNYLRLSEMLFYKNARKSAIKYVDVDSLTKYDDWCFQWASELEEVWSLDSTYNEVTEIERPLRLCRVFPPVGNEPCPCILCAKYDHFGQENVPYMKPAPKDVKGHELLFNEHEVPVQWPNDVPTPFALNPIRNWVR
ncbi:uncharacterized protein F4822DRAFT_431678 [Hypoxylon trugodes]|uniref:uncharacterized protein n=1 Tax=Hypoxylon trugodes TaxID=326681 RepID=UPI002190C57E|nr:uncharacterized protein F4822DRAFT_431678 [Hypoxylon trugodes]KAI1386810.1 hypothetical protein F4822DRAFT_431678 [Hypoxylon trugodes]